MALYPTLPLVKDVAEAFKNNKEQENLIPEGLSYGSPIDTTNVREVVLIYSSYSREHEVYLPRIGRETQ